MKTGDQGSKQPETLQDELRTVRFTSQFFGYCRQAADRLDYLETELEKERLGLKHYKQGLSEVAAERDVLKEANEGFEARVKELESLHKTAANEHHTLTDTIYTLKAQVSELEVLREADALYVDEQSARIDTLTTSARSILAALEDILDYDGGADNALDDGYVMERAHAARGAAISILKEPSNG